MIEIKVFQLNRDDFQIHALESSYPILKFNIISIFRLVIDGNGTVLKHNGVDLYVDPNQNPHGVNIDLINQTLRDENIKSFTDGIREHYMAYKLLEDIQTTEKYGTFFYCNEAETYT